MAVGYWQMIWALGRLYKRQHISPTSQMSRITGIRVCGAQPTFIIIILLCVLGEWKESIRRFLSNDFDIIEYTAEPESVKPTKLTRGFFINRQQRETVVITNYEFFRSRHGEKVIDEFARTGDVMGVDSPDLSVCFILKILDEAHTLKYVTTAKSKAVNRLGTKFALLPTGTPAENRDTDLGGRLGVFWLDSLWDELEPTRNVNPFRLPTTDPRSALCATRFAVDRFLDIETKETTRGEYLGRIYDMVLLNRTYSSSDGKEAILG
jgi:SNF2 family DNA or RNA helicase